MVTKENITGFYEKYIRNLEWENDITEEIADELLLQLNRIYRQGYETAQAIRKLEKERGHGGHLPIIALTAKVFAEDADMATNAGMDAHLGKPVELQKILATLVQWTEKHENGTK